MCICISIFIYHSLKYAIRILVMRYPVYITLKIILLYISYNLLYTTLSRYIIKLLYSICKILYHYTFPYLQAQMYITEL